MSFTANYYWLECVPVMISLLVPILIAFYQRTKGTGTVNSYMLGGRTMSVTSITLSHISASISVNGLLGAPSELYVYGPHNSTALITMAALGLVGAYVVLPVMYDLQLLSLFEYCERRFNRTVRLITSLINAIWELTYSAINAYGCAMVLSLFLGTDISIAIFITIGFCIVYTTLGGYKGVVYADAFQSLIMGGYIILICVLGLRRAGGITELIKTVSQSDRSDFFDFSLDPKSRTNTWNVLIGLFFTRSLSHIGSTTYQRSISLPTLKKAQKSLMIAIVFTLCFVLISESTGYILYAEYRGCDPTLAKVISRPDLTIVHFVQTIGQSIPGVMGFFVAGILCSSLSSMATCLNNSSGVIYRDFFQIIFKTARSEAQDSRNIKTLCVVLGLLVWLIADSLEKIGNINLLSRGLNGLSSGAVAAVFALGLFFPRVGSKEILCGVIPWLGITIFVLAIKLTTVPLRYPTKVLRVDECPFNVTAPLRNSSLPLDLDSWNGVNFIQKISPFWFSTIGFVFVLSVSIAASHISTRRSRQANVVDTKLLSPLVRKSSHMNRREVEMQPFTSQTPAST